ncbi:MAG: hypothetical protein U0324_28425 [Polyangiales bacterium]
MNTLPWPRRAPAVAARALCGARSLRSVRARHVALGSWSGTNTSPSRVATVATAEGGVAPAGGRTQASSAGTYAAPSVSSPAPPRPPQITISCPVHTAAPEPSS